MGERKKNHRKKTFLVIAGISLCLFFIAAYFVSGADFLFIDTWIRGHIYGWRSPAANVFFVLITYLGNWQTVILLACLLLLFQRTRKEIGLPFSIAALSSTVIYKIAKEIFRRPRPDEAFHLISQGGYSFPSGHAMNCIVCYGMLIYLIRRYAKNRSAASALTGILSVLILLIGFSRIYVGVHFPTDIFGGWSLGLSILCISILVLEKFKGEKNDLQ